MTPSLDGISWREFLGRPAIEPPPREVLSALFNKPILVTGAGGSIGCALSARLAQLDLSALLLLEAGENALFELQRTLTDDRESASPAVAPTRFVLGNAGDRALMENLFAAYKPRIVFHAAAYKHVPLLETQPFAAITNNIFATENVAAAASRYGAHVVLLSTDKAVEPASVMGATKRVAEQIVLAHGGTVLRLGNVLASSGSVTEVFVHQIARGGPLTITDAAAQRYFLTLDEAVNLLLLAAMRRGASMLLAPALPAMHRVVQLADFMTNQLADGLDIRFLFTELRPGEKLAERLWSGSDRTSPVGAGSLLSIQANRLTEMQLCGGIAALRAATEEHDLHAALIHLRSLVPGFHPSDTVLALANDSIPRVSA